MKKIIAIGVLVVLCGMITAQDPTQEYSIFASGGLSSLRANSARGGTGCEFGIGYTYFLQNYRVSVTGSVRNHKLGIHTGVGLGFYGTELTINEKGTRIITEKLHDSEGDRFEMRTSLTNYVETQRALMLNIPVMGRYDNDQYFVMLGVKLGVPLNGKYSSKCEMLSNEAWYSDYHFSLFTQTFAGFGDFENYTSKGNHDFRVSVALALESGLKWRIDKYVTLYAGLYFDIGLKKIAGKDDFHFITYESGMPATFSTRSINSVFDEKARILAAGVKLRLAFGR